MFACTKNECPREVIRRRRNYSAEKFRFQEREDRGREIRERKQLLEELRHQEKVDYLHRRPIEEAPASGDAFEKQMAKAAHALQVVQRKKQLEKQRLSQLEHERKLKDNLNRKKRPVRKSRLKNDDDHIRQVQESKAQQLKEHQETAEMGFGFRSHMADLRLAELKKAKQAACEALRKQTQTAAQKVLQKQKQIEQHDTDVVKQEIELKNQRANYVLGIEPEKPVKCLYKPRPKQIPPPNVPPKYNLLEKTYNLEFLRLKFKSDEAMWHRRNRDFPLPTLDDIILDWKRRSRFEDPDLQFGEVQKEFANAEETLQLEHRFSWISNPVSVQVMQEICLANLVPSEEEYAALGVREKIALHEEMRGRQLEAVEEKIERLVRRQQVVDVFGTVEKLEQLDQGVDTGRDNNGEDEGGSEFDYATLLYKNVLRRWEE